MPPARFTTSPRLEDDNFGSTQTSTAPVARATARDFGSAALERNTPISSTIPSAAFQDNATTTPPSAGTNLADIQAEINRVTDELGGITSGVNRLQVNQPTPLSTPDTFARDFGVPENRINAAGEIIDPTTQEVAAFNERFTTTTPEAPTDSGSFSDLLKNFREGRSSFLDTAKTALGIGGEQTSLADRATELLPETPQALTNIDIQLGDLQSQFQEASNGIQNQAGVGLRFIEGDQRRLNREFEAQEARLLRRRDAISGDFDRSTQRAKDILALEQEDRKEERERQATAINLLGSQLEGEEGILLAQLQRQFEREDLEDQRRSDAEIARLDEINDIVKNNKEEFQKFFEGGGEIPTTVSEAARIAAENFVPEVADTPTGSTGAERKVQAISTFSSALVPGATFNGTPVIGGDGFMSPEVWRSAIADAPSEGLDRQTFIENFGHLVNIDKKAIDSYGLTAVEKKLITGII